MNAAVKMLTYSVKQKACIKNGNSGNLCETPTKALLKSKYIVLISTSLITVIRKENLLGGNFL